MCEGLICVFIWLKTPETSKASFCCVVDEIYTFRKKVNERVYIFGVNYYFILKGLYNILKVPLIIV